METGDDCFYFLYSNCAKGPACTFRHVEGAKSSPVCTNWLEGVCTLHRCPQKHFQQTTQCRFEKGPMGCANPNCDYIHYKPKGGGGAQATALAAVTPPTKRCYYETQPSGCMKPDCHFSHLLPRPNTAAAVSVAPTSFKPHTAAAATATFTKPVNPKPTFVPTQNGGGGAVGGGGVLGGHPTQAARLAHQNQQPRQQKKQQPPQQQQPQQQQQQQQAHFQQHPQANQIPQRQFPQQQQQRQQQQQQQQPLTNHHNPNLFQQLQHHQQPQQQQQQHQQQQLQQQQRHNQHQQQRQPQPQQPQQLLLNPHRSQQQLQQPQFQPQPTLPLQNQLHLQVRGGNGTAPSINLTTLRQQRSTHPTNTNTNTTAHNASVNVTESNQSINLEVLRMQRLAKTVSNHDTNTTNNNSNNNNSNNNNNKGNNSNGPAVAVTVSLQTKKRKMEEVALQQRKKAILATATRVHVEPKAPKRHDESRMASGNVRGVAQPTTTPTPTAITTTRATRKLSTQPTDDSSPRKRHRHETIVVTSKSNAVSKPKERVGGAKKATPIARATTTATTATTATARPVTGGKGPVIIDTRKPQASDISKALQYLSPMSDICMRRFRCEG